MRRRLSNFLIDLNAQQRLQRDRPARVLASVRFDGALESGVPEGTPELRRPSAPNSLGRAGDY
jgi:hypothetical protein